MNRTPVYSLVIANCVSLLGGSLTRLAIPWFVLETTGSAGKAGISGAFAFMPAFLAGILGGGLIDRVGARKCAIVADIVSGVAILMVPLLYHTVGLEFWQLLVFVLLGSLLEIPGVTARRSLLPELAKLGNVKLERVNSILEGNNQVSGFIGPPIAGVLIGLLGTSNVLWIDGATSLFSAASLLLFVPRNIHAHIRVASEGYIKDLRAGLTFLWRDPLLRSISFGSCLINAFGTPFFSLIFMVYAQRRFDDARYLGLMLSAFSLGMIAGTALYGWIGYKFSRRAYIVVLFLTIAIPFWPLATTFPFAILLGLFAIGGIIDGPVNPLLVTVRQERIPIELRGRVFAATSAIAQLLPAATIPITGLMIEQLGLRPTVIILASQLQIAAIFLATRPVWKRMDEATSQRELQPIGMP